MNIRKLCITSLLSFVMISTAQLTSHALEIQEIKGKDRYETAALIADKMNYTTAILVNSDKTLADGLSASGLAGATNAPILLTQNDKIPTMTIDRLSNVKNVYIIGGKNSISNNIETQLTNKNMNVKRIEGFDRIQTSINVAKEIEKYKTIDTIALVNAYKDADAMSISPLAVRDKMPIILTDGKTTTYNTKDKTAYIIGGTASMGDSIALDAKKTRFSGKDRFETNQSIISEFYGYKNDYYISDGYKLVDALTGSTLAKDGGIVFVSFESDKRILKSAQTITSFGGINEGILHDIYITIGENENKPNLISKEKAERMALESTSNYSGVSINNLTIDKSEFLSAIDTSALDPVRVYYYEFSIMYKTQNEYENITTWDQFIIDAKTGKRYGSVQELIYVYNNNSDEGVY